jgi:phosphoribosylformimino-5-aminoimidazole carboxamide ribotide isomerase
MDNAMNYLSSGASHVVVTSFVFNDGRVDFPRLQALSALVSRERLVIDLSCRKRVGDITGSFYVVTNKWTKYTDFPVT